MSFLVAEIGVNWDGDFEIVKKLMEIAKKSQCDAVKFQSFNEEIVKEHPESQRLLKSSISKNNIEEINSLAKTIGIEWFSTPMYPEAVSLLNPYVKRFKLRESDSHILFQNKSNSILDEISVYKARMRMGQKLAKKILKLNPEHDIDVVIPIPDSSTTAALQLAAALKLPYRQGFVKNRYVGRTFIMPNQEERKKSVRRKLNILDLEFKDKNVLLVDDSIVRGNLHRLSKIAICR